MPEGPEVLQYRDFFANFTKHKSINDVKIISGRYTHQTLEGLDDFSTKLPCKVISTEVKGKFMWVSFDNGYYLAVNYGLKGGWTDDKTNINIRIEFITNKDSIYFIDMRNFGTLFFTSTFEDIQIKLDKIGPDMMNKNTTFDIFNQQIKIKKNLNKDIAVVLLDQDIISGIGNYLRADSLWCAAISPYRKTKDITIEEMHYLYEMIRYNCYLHYNLKLGIELGIIAADPKNINNPDPAKYIIVEDYEQKFYHEKNNFFFVYDRSYDIFGNEVKADELKGRTIYWTPTRQT